MHANAPATTAPTVAEPPSADPTDAAAIRTGPATAMTLLQFRTSLLSLTYSAVSLSLSTRATSAISVSISLLHPLLLFTAASVLGGGGGGGGGAALLGHHTVGFTSEGNFSSMPGSNGRG
ncbi:hypothetical protein AMTRI_Chr09g14380 [Amborella trichopoda]